MSGILNVRILYIVLFGVVGVLSRYSAGFAITRILPPTFPFTTFIVNISGSFAIGVFHVLGAERAAISPDLRTGILVGFLGGYTTFSTYCLEAVRLTEDGDYLHATLYWLLSPVLGYLAALGGILLTRLLTQGAGPT